MSFPSSVELHFKPSFVTLRALKLCMHVNFATLRDKQALEGWICSLEPLHDLKSICMDEGLKGLDE